MSLLHEFFHYLLPPDVPSSRLPLLPRTYIARTTDADHEATLNTRYLKGKAVARTNRDAHGLIAKHPEKRVQKIARIERRKRRREPRLKKVIRRLLLLWKAG